MKKTYQQHRSLKVCFKNQSLNTKFYRKKLRHQRNRSSLFSFPSAWYKIESDGSAWSSDACGKPNSSWKFVHCLEIMHALRFLQLNTFIVACKWSTISVVRLLVVSIFVTNFMHFPPHISIVMNKPEACLFIDATWNINTRRYWTVASGRQIGLHESAQPEIERSRRAQNGLSAVAGGTKWFLT